MIRDINKKGTACLYNPTVMVGPMVTHKREGQAGMTLEGEQVSSLTGQQDDGTGKFVAIWPSDITELVQDLKETCEDIADTCMGMASTQIWWKKDPCPAIFVMRWPIAQNEDEQTDAGNIKRGWRWQEFINPIVKLSGKTQKLEEGCLSYPNLTVKKTRKGSVDFVYQTLENPKQQRLKLNMKSHGWVPHVIQHEYDHLRGVCIRSKNWTKD